MRDETDFKIEIDRLLADYIGELDQSNLKPLSAQAYQVQAINFVRWITKGILSQEAGNREILMSASSRIIPRNSGNDCPILLNVTPIIWDTWDNFND